MWRLSGLFLVSFCLLAADVAVDNDTVRILKAVDLPHNKGPLHRHEFNRVMIYLDAGDITIGHEGGRKEEQHWKAGQVAWSPAGGMHTSENVGSAPVRIIEIELKKPGPKSPPQRNAALDPVAIDPTHNVLLFENDQARVFRSWREPGGHEPMHEHLGAGKASVLLTDLEATQLIGSTSTPMRGSAGDVLWSGPVTHSTTNTAKSKFEIVVVEVK